MVNADDGDNSVWCWWWGRRNKYIKRVHKRKYEKITLFFISIFLFSPSGFCFLYFLMHNRFYFHVFSFFVFSEWFWMSYLRNNINGSHFGNHFEHLNDEGRGGTSDKVCKENRIHKSKKCVPNVLRKVTLSHSCCCWRTRNTWKWKRRWKGKFIPFRHRFVFSVLCTGEFIHHKYITNNSRNDSVALFLVNMVSFSQAKAFKAHM